MVECRNCRATFEKEPEDIGARCPECKVPLFERHDRPRRDVESGTCVVHADVPGVVSCARCHARLCAQCRTRWHDSLLCLTCVENSIAAEERHPREIKSWRMMAIRGFVLAMIGAFAFLMGLWILYAARHDPTSGAVPWSIILIFVAAIPGAFALGQSAAVILTRGPLLRLANSAVVVASSQIGLTIGLLVVNFWRN